MIIFPILKAVREVQGLKYPQKSLLLILALHAPYGKGGREIYISQELLAAEAGGGLKSCYTALKKLQEGGWIEQEAKKKGYIQGYKINLVKLGLAPEKLEEIEELGDLGDLGDGIQEEIEQIRNSPRMRGEEHLTEDEIERRKEEAIAFLLQR